MLNMFNLAGIRSSGTRRGRNPIASEPNIQKSPSRSKPPNKIECKRLSSKFRPLLVYSYTRINKKLVELLERSQADPRPKYLHALINSRSLILTGNI